MYIYIYIYIYMCIYILTILRQVSYKCKLSKTRAYVVAISFLET